MTTTIDERRGSTSASNAMADSLCPGRHLAQRGLPDTTSSASETGTRIHAALSGAIDPATLSLEEQTTRDMCLDIERRKVAEFFGANADKVKCWREDPAASKSRFWVRFGTFEHSCRPDVVYTYGGRGLILEYKTLAGDVPHSSRNLQLRDQQCIVRGQFILTGDIGVCVVQPMVSMNPDICVYSNADSDRATAEMFSRIERSNDPASSRVAGEYQCQFCKARGLCAEYQKFAGALVPGILNLLDVAVADWSPEQRVLFCDRVGVAEKWLTETWAAMKEGVARDPNFVPGYELKPGNKRETITDPQKLWDRFAAIGGKLEQFMGTVSIGKAKLKEAVAAAAGVKGKALDTKVKELTDGIVEVSQNAPSLVKSKEVK